MKRAVATAFIAWVGCSQARVEPDGGELHRPTSSADEPAREASSTAPLAPLHVSGLVARMGHRALLLPDGRGFVAGGHDRGLRGVARCQSFDPRSRSWTDEGLLDTPVSFPMLARLPEGGVLVAGGIGPPGRTTAAAQRCDTRSHRCVAIASMREPRTHGAAVALGDGRVVVIGGVVFDPIADRRVLATAEELDPRNGTWSAVGDLHEARCGHGATALKDGRVLVSGGWLGGEADPALSSLEIYDPESRAFRDAGRMKSARAEHTATLLSDGRVLLAGGFVRYKEVTATAEIFDPSTGQTTAVGSMGRPRRQHDALRLMDGRVWVVGGDDAGLVSFNLDSPTSELFDPQKAQWSPGPSLVTARNGVRLLPVEGTRVLAFGGYTGQEVVAKEEMLEAPRSLPR